MRLIVRLREVALSGDIALSSDDPMNLPHRGGHETATFQDFDSGEFANFSCGPAGVLHPRTREAGFFHVQDGRAVTSVKLVEIRYCS